MTVHQVLPTWEPGAIGTHALHVARALEAAGIACATWADEIRPGLAGEAHPTAELLGARARRGDVLLFHTAMGTATAELVLARPEPLVVDHHNITPPSFFDAWEPALAENLELAQRQVARLARRAVLGLADSAFNAHDLRRDGCRRTAIVPVMADYARFGVVAHPAWSSTSPTKWLFVGRLAPNKAQHDVVRAFAWYRAAYDADARLHLVGSAPFDGYAAALHRLIERLGVGAAVELTGSVSDDELADQYRTADVYVSCSAHEGFAVPVVEAMAAGVPVVALAATAVPETAGAAALLVDRADPALIATAVARLRRDPDLRASFVAAGVARAAELAPERSATALIEAIAPIVRAA